MTAVAEPGNLARKWRSTPAGEASNGQIEATPEKMNRACLADKPCTEFLEHTIHLHEGPPKSLCGVGIVGCMGAIIAEWRSRREFRRAAR